MMGHVKTPAQSAVTYPPSADDRLANLADVLDTSGSMVAPPLKRKGENAMPDGMMIAHEPTKIAIFPAVPTLSRRATRANARLEKEREWQRRFGWINELTEAESSGDYCRDNHLGSAICYRYMANIVMRAAEGDPLGTEVSDILLKLAALDSALGEARRGIFVGFGYTFQRVGLPVRGLSAKYLLELAAMEDDKFLNYEAYEQARQERWNQEARSARSERAKQAWAKRRAPAG